ncbi:MAG: sugar phosphate isomerase/epimerase [Planctomycetota bacterium]
MKLGMNLLLWTAEVKEEHFPILQSLKEAGFDGVEVPVAPGTEADFSKLAKVLDDMGLERTAVFALGEEANPISPDAPVREAAREALKVAIGKTQALGAHRLVGPFHSAFKTFSGAPPTEDERQRSADVLRDTAEIAENADVLLAVEPLNRFECYLMNTIAAARAVIDRVDHPACGILYDTHHMHIEEKKAADAVTRAADRITHVHVSESDRGTPGSGQVAWLETFSALQAAGYDDWLVIEAFSRQDEAFASAIHVWRNYDPLEEIWRRGHAFIRGTWERVLSDG